jgi:hypothetical protein
VARVGFMLEAHDQIIGIAVGAGVKLTHPTE